MYNYFSQGGPNAGVMANSRYEKGYVLTDMADEHGNGGPWVWIYKREEIYVQDGVDSEGEPIMDFRGYRFVCQDEAGQPFDASKAEHTAEGPDYDIIAYDNGEVPEGLEVGL